METILTLIEDQATAAALRSILNGGYEFFEWGQQPDTALDLCIFDEFSFRRAADWIRTQKQFAAPAVFPVLVVVNPSALNPAFDEECFDDVLVLPMQPVELRTRVKSLLRLRRVSLKLSRQEERLIGIGKALDSTSDAILITDNNGASIFCNRAFLALYEFSEEDLNSGGIANTLFTSPDTARHLFETIREGKTWSGEVLLEGKFGRMVPTLLTSDRIEDQTGRPLGMISVFTDITERKRAEVRAQEQRILSDALRDIAATLSRTLDLEEVLKRILSNVGRVVAHDAANIMLIETDIARIVGHQGYQQWGFDTARLAALRVKISDAHDLRTMVEEQKPFIVSDVRHAGWQSPLPADWLRSHIGVPICSRGRVIGFLHLESRQPGFFTLIHAEWLQSFAEQAAIAIQNAQLHRQAKELARMTERQRIARDLHDAVSQTLFSASMIAEALERLWEQNPQKVLPRLKQLHLLTRGALAEMRTLLLELRPDALQEAETSELFQQLIEGIQGRTWLDISLDLQVTDALPSNVRVALYHVTQEALNNIVKHAEAEKVSIRLVENAQHVTLDIEDNGHGFDPAAVSPTSMGLKIMGERVEGIDAELEVKTRQGEGTHIRVIWTK